MIIMCSMKLTNKRKLNSKDAYIYKSTLFFILFLLFPVAWQTQAQSNKEKKLQQIEREIATGNLNDKELFQKYDDLTWNYYPINFEKTRYYCHKGIALAREKKNIGEEAKFLTSMGEMYDRFNVRDSIFIYFDKALQLIDGKEYYEEECNNYKARGNFYLVRYDCENALKSYLKAMELNEKDKLQRIANEQSLAQNLRSEVGCLNNIASIYGQIYNTDKQIKYLTQAIKIMTDNPSVDFKNTEHEIYGNLAAAYMNNEEDDKALPLIKKSYELATSKEDPENIVFGLINYARYYTNKGNYEKTIDCGKKALEIAEKANLQREIHMAVEILMRSYLYIKDYKTTLDYARHLLLITSEENWLTLQNSYLFISMIYAVMGDIEQAYKYIDKHRALITKISDGSLHNALQEMEVKYETAEKQLEIERQKTEISRRKSQQVALGSVLIATALLIILLAYIVILRGRRTRALTEMNAIKDKFFSIISHDLKNPVVTQRNALQILTANINKWDANTISGYSEKLLKQSDDMVNLLKNLLNWSLIQSGRNTYYPIMFNLIAALQPDINVIKSMAERKNITFETLTPKIVIVTADQNMLTTVVRNLLVNAVKFTTEGGKITLKITEENEKYTISVTDTGIGMSQAHINDLFRLESAHSHPGTAGEQGSALGLIICKEMIEKHESTLYVESAEGAGSKFWFTLN